jgi:uncharacterized protein (TIGR03435 family)
LLFVRTVTTLLFLYSLAALAQPAPPSFEVASVRASERGEESIVTGPASLTMKNIHLIGCIRWAYNVSEMQVSGPDWLNEGTFDIFAKSAGEVKVAELREMLKTLLADRFKLRAHSEMKEMPALVVTVAKNGHKMKPVDVEGSPSFKTGDMNLTGQGATVGQLTEFISKAIHVPMIDQTGLTGRYNYFLDIKSYVTEEMRKSNGPPPEANTIIATAMQEQLGLKVEAKKTPIEMVIVDHMEKTPTEN